MAWVSKMINAGVRCITLPRSRKILTGHLVRILKCQNWAMRFMLWKSASYHLVFYSVANVFLVFLEQVKNLPVSWVNLNLAPIQINLFQQFCVKFIFLYPSVGLTCLFSKYWHFWGKLFNRLHSKQVDIISMADFVTCLKKARILASIKRHSLLHKMASLAVHLFFRDPYKCFCMFWPIYCQRNIPHHS